jgi:hypothetical protein
VDDKSVVFDDLAHEMPLAIEERGSRGFVSQNQKFGWRMHVMMLWIAHVLGSHRAADLIVGLRLRPQVNTPGLMGVRPRCAIQASLSR